MNDYLLRPVGVVRSPITDRKNAPKQGMEGAPDVWLELSEPFSEALLGMKAGDVIFVITWLHQAHRETLQVHPRKNRNKPLMGVFATRSPDRPNPLGLHQVTIRFIEGSRLLVGPLEAIDGTPIVDIKPVICP
jgi:tRNA-Thr(GGU) m(6)t(6)A37 methyltransferase TsaA